jgi:hypothetical protein
LLKTWPGRFVLLALVVLGVLYVADRLDHFNRSMMCGKYLWDAPHHSGHARVVSKKLLQCTGCTFYDHDKVRKEKEGQYGELTIDVMDLGDSDCEGYLREPLRDLGRSLQVMNVDEKFASAVDANDVIEFDFGIVSGKPIRAYVRGYSGNITIKR